MRVFIPGSLEAGLYSARSWLVEVFGLIVAYRDTSRSMCAGHENEWSSEGQYIRGKSPGR
jgi:hypothetical protein